MDEKQELSDSKTRNSGVDKMNNCSVTANNIVGEIIYNFPPNPAPTKQEELKIKASVICDDHKYDGNLVLFELDFFGNEQENINDKNVIIKLTISFNEAQEQFSFLSPLRNTTVNVRFGIKRGELYLIFDNSSIPLLEREILESEDWKANPSGHRNPKWVFTTRKENNILKGSLKDRKLAAVDLLSNASIEALFKVDINRQDIEVIFLDNAANNKKAKETKIGAFLKYIKPKLEDYVGRVEYRLLNDYDSAINS